MKPKDSEALSIVNGACHVVRMVTCHLVEVASRARMETIPSYVGESQEYRRPCFRICIQHRTSRRKKYCHLKNPVLLRRWHVVSDEELHVFAAPGEPNKVVVYPIHQEFHKKTRDTRISVGKRAPRTLHVQLPQIPRWCIMVLDILL